jgi:hypothetical protein
MKTTMTVVCALVGVASELGASEPLSLKVRPNVAMAPATITVLAMIEPDAQNRVVEIVTESDDFYRSSQIPLEGDHARRANQLELRSLPPGLYSVTATLKGPGDRTRAMIHESVNIMGAGRDPGGQSQAQAPAAGPR